MQSTFFFCQEERWNGSEMLDKANSTIFFISYLFSRLQIWMRTISEIHLKRIASLDYYAYTYEIGDYEEDKSMDYKEGCKENRFSKLFNFTSRRIDLNGHFLPFRKV